jgi:hypothetical protein
MAHAALLWLFSREEEQAEPKPAAVPPNGVPPAPVVNAPLPPKATPTAKRVRREDVAEVLEYGARRMTKQEAVAALQTLGFGKTAAYNALSQTGRFADFLHHTPTGLLNGTGDRTSDAQ